MIEDAQIEATKSQILDASDIPMPVKDIPYSDKQNLNI